MKIEKVLVDVKIICDRPEKRWFYNKPTLEEIAEYCEKWVKEFDEFIRDHRSQDPVNLSVERVYEDICEFCKREWEVDEDGIPQCCQKAVDEFNSLSSHSEEVK